MLILIDVCRSDTSSAFLAYLSQYLSPARPRYEMPSMASLGRFFVISRSRGLRYCCILVDELVRLYTLGHSFPTLFISMGDAAASR